MMVSLPSVIPLNLRNQLSAGSYKPLGRKAFFSTIGRLLPARSLAAFPCSKSILRP